VPCQTQEARQDAEARRLWKLRLIKGLYERGLDKRQVRELFRLIDWMMDLPASLVPLFWQEMTQFEQEKCMPYVTSIERYAREEAKRETLLENILSGLRLKFGAEGLQMRHELEAVTDPDKLRSIHDAMIMATSLEDVRRLVG
jgi:hypothetical protein